MHRHGDFALIVVLLNAIPIKDSFPSLTIDELINELFKANFFTKLDLRFDYHQILIDEED